MSLINKLKAQVRSWVRKIVHEEVKRAVDEVYPIVAQLVEFQASRPEERQSFYDHTKNPAEDRDIHAALSDRLVQLGVRVRDESVDIADFRRWLDVHPAISAKYRGHPGAHIEKCLEHYLSFTLLALSSFDRFIDVAAGSSPYADILHRELGLATFRMDLSYPAGISGRDIGVDAGDTRLPCGFATAMALHCSYECFMGDADVRFVREAARILAPGGRYVITPLYLGTTFQNITSPYCNQRKVAIDPGASRIWRDDSYITSSFARIYSPEVFAERIYSRIPGDMTGTVYFFRNLPDVSRSFGGERIYCYFLFHCTKAT